MPEYDPSFLNLETAHQIIAIQINNLIKKHGDPFKALVALHQRNQELEEQLEQLKRNSK
jgi:hypothetical protein